jgi:hypothetical protein
MIVESREALFICWAATWNLVLVAAGKRSRAIAFMKMIKGQHLGQSSTYLLIPFFDMV